MPTIFAEVFINNLHITETPNPAPLEPEEAQVVENLAPNPEPEPFPMAVHEDAQVVEDLAPNPEPAPLPEPNRQDARLTKVTTVPVHLRFILSPRCDPWAKRVERDLLRQLLRHFVPDLYVPIRTTKPAYIRLFYEHIVAEYGVFYGY